MGSLFDSRDIMRAYCEQDVAFASFFRPQVYVGPDSRIWDPFHAHLDEIHLQPRSHVRPRSSLSSAKVQARAIKNRAQRAARAVTRRSRK